MATSTRHALRRLMTDQEELIQSPVTNVSATPLDSDMFEWHCNIKQDHCIFHVILYFPPNYPYAPPSAEFVPTGFHYNHGMTTKGKKGDTICLSIFSDFAAYHNEWANEKGSGWSPGYTAQTALLNVVSFLNESYYTYPDDPEALVYRNLCQAFRCVDCGHSFEEPYPAFEVTHSAPDTTFRKEKVAPFSDVVKGLDEISLQIVDYVSKEKFDSTKVPSRDELFGYGLVVKRRGQRLNIRSPCEFLTTGTYYGMIKAVRWVYSTRKEMLMFFLPLYMNKLHGSQIKEEFQNLLYGISPILFVQYERSNEDIILELIPHLMCSTVLQFSRGFQHISDSSLQGYFNMHRLFLWATEAYPEVENEIENRLHSFVSDPQKRTKDSCPDISQWLILLSVSKNITWKSVANAYLSECFRRNATWYIQSDKMLSSLKTSKQYRLKRTFEITNVSRRMLSFQVAFLKIARNKTDTLNEEHGDLGRNTVEMVADMKIALQKMKSDIKDFKSWYRSLGLEAPSMDTLNATFMEAVAHAQSMNGHCVNTEPTTGENEMSPNARIIRPLHRINTETTSEEEKTFLKDRIHCVNTEPNTEEEKMSPIVRTILPFCSMSLFFCVAGCLIGFIAHYDSMWIQRV